MKKTAYLVTIQPEVANTKPEQRVYTTAEDLCVFIKNAGTAVIVSEVLLFD